MFLKSLPLCRFSDYKFRAINMRSSFRYIVLPAVIALVIFYLTCIVSVDSIPGPRSMLQYDKLAHFGMFFSLSAAIYYDYYRLHKGRPNKLKWLLFGLVMPVIYGGVIEIVQQNYFLRSGEFLDFAADSLGSLSATILAFIYVKMRRKQ